MSDLIVEEPSLTPGGADRLEGVLMIINASTAGRSAIPADRSRERLADFAALKVKLDGEIIDWNTINATGWTRLLARVAGKGAALAALAFARRNRYRLFYCDGENNGLILSLLFKFSRTRLPLMMIGHWITPPKKALLFKWLKLHKNITTLFLHSSAQYTQAIQQFGFPADRLRLLPYQVDTQFWRGEHANPTAYAGDRPYICTAGLEFRDYATLTEAVRGLAVDLKIGAASHWSKRTDSTLQTELPPNVEVRSYNYSELRDLYAGSKFVVVPLLNVNFQAGITLILEAMAMGKAVIVTRSEGQGDIIIDRRKAIRTDVPLPTFGNFGQFFPEDTTKLRDLSGQTGFYVPPGDPRELRKAIQYLLDNPHRAIEMGQRARRVVESLMSVELFAERIHQVVAETLEPDQSPS